MIADQTRYVIIGGSAAGMAAATAIRDLDLQGPITVLSEEADMPYFRPMIPFLISGKRRASDMALMGKGPYQGAGIDVRTGARVNRVDESSKTVTIKNGDPINFDKLLIAAGSRPYIPPEIQGTDADGVFALRTLHDAREASKRAEKTSHVIMLGGGMLNLKAAFALLERGLEVTLVVYSAEVLSQLMDPDDAILIRNALNEAGLKIITGCGAKKILSDQNGVKAVLLSNGQEMSCQMVFIGKGVSPNLGFLSESSIEMDNGVIVDKYTATNVSNIFAAGDVAVTFDPINDVRIVTGLWTNAVEMGRCAGYNMAGKSVQYPGTFGILNATQIADVPFVSMGVVHTKDTEYETHTHSSKNAYRKLVFSSDGKRLIGAVFVGDISRAGLYRFVIREKMSINDLKSEIINQTLHYGHFINKC